MDENIDDPMDDLDVNMAIWGIFLNTTLRAAVHLGKDHDTNLRFEKNHLWKTTGQLFRETGQDYEAKLRFVKNHLWKSEGQLFNENEKLISAMCSGGLVALHLNWLVPPCVHLFPCRCASQGQHRG